MACAAKLSHQKTGINGMEAAINAVIGFLHEANDIVWGPIMLVLLVGTGMYLTIRLKFLSFRQIPHGFAQLWKGRKKGEAQGELSPFNALMLALAGTIGTGSIAGVATAIVIGGPGAIFWMTFSALMGMATKFSEIVLSVHFRQVTPAGNYVGGAMYSIREGLKDRYPTLAKVLPVCFCIFSWIACIGTGNLVQGNAIAGALESSFQIPQTATAAVLFLGVAAVLLGGVKRIGEVAGRVVPTMAMVYTIASLTIIGMHITALPKIFCTILEDAFSPAAAVGGFTGATVMMALRMGIARGIYSNEAGLGTAPIAHATAMTDSPVKQGFIGMLDTFLTTVVVCNMTAFVILVTGEYITAGGVNGAPLTAKAFQSALAFIHPDLGSGIVSICLTFFAFTTILAWAVYGERAMIFLIGDKAQKPYRILYCLMVPAGCLFSLDLVWLIADTFNALMAIPNLFGILLLSPVVIRLANEYMAKHRY